MSDTPANFSKFNLHPSIMTALKEKGYEKPTPIQDQAIGHLLSGGDMLGIAQTGTGKTAAFALPIIHNIAKNKVKVKPTRMRCLIMTPTRELAAQIEENIKLYSKGLGVKSAVIFGGVSAGAQVKKLVKGQDIIIATPGRLLDHMNEGRINFEQLEVFVLDEADRMLDMGFIRDVRKIIAKLPPAKERQTLLFSATMPRDIEELAGDLLIDPKRVEVTPESTTVEKIRQKVHLVERSYKPKLLIEILQDRTNEVKNMIVFTRTKHGANRVARHLENADIKAAAIHGNKSQGAREKALKGLKTGHVQVLVATDIAARGIDVPNLTHVVNYDLPEDPKSYVHRIGRTGRAGRKGMAISFCEPGNKGLYRQIEKAINMKIPVDENHSFHGLAADNSGDKSKLKNPNLNKKKRPTQRRRHKPAKKQAKS